jgi:hypothetical protein
LRGRVAILTAFVIVGAILLLNSVNVGFNIGSEWFGTGASSPWHINNYIVIQAKYAYAYFGLAALAIGGLATGLAAPAFFAFAKSKKHRLVLASSFFIAIILTGLGFNTLDFMLGAFYWTNMKYPPPVSVPVLGSVDVWNYYFFFFVAPLWLGGFIMGLTTSYYAFVYQPKHLGASYATKKKYTELLGQNMQKTADNKEYVVETGTFSRNRKPFFKQDRLVTNLSHNEASSKSLFSKHSRSVRSTGDSTSNP